MKKLTVNEIRQTYLDFFKEKSHTVLPSFSVVPHNDKSLLLINSGMAPMKAYFTGKETPPSPRVATCQKCIRTGDIENVGKTARHGTFFEMLGNFSFGDYFKDDIIPWSWEFVTKTLEIPEDKLFVTIYEEDEQSGDVWRDKVGVAPDRIVRLGKEDNFWQHGTGPCGPCTEIYFDRGEAYSCGEDGCAVGCDCDRYMEFWNLVLTQYNANEDGTYTELAQKNVDTGMGLERMATILQGVDSIFDVDTIEAIRNSICEKAGIKYGDDAQKDISVRVITDHIRSVTVMTADGVLPSNEGRGYVLRRLLRRAVRHGKLLGIDGQFLSNISEVVVKNSGDVYTELVTKKEHIFSVLSREEDSFHKTIDNGMDILKDYIADMKSKNISIMAGEQSFKLYDTYGFPVDLTAEILEENNLTLDEKSFDEEMQKQKTRARSARKTDTYMGAEDTVYNTLPVDLTTTFLGYNATTMGNGTNISAKITALVANGKIENICNDKDDVVIFLDNTCFYAESGGQIGDRGIIKTSKGRCEITNTIKVVGGKVGHIGNMIEGTFEVGEDIEFAEVIGRKAVCCNHTATHMLQNALRKFLGNHVEQAGSQVNGERLRFDFTNSVPMTTEDIEKVETYINTAISTGQNVVVEEMGIDKAREKGAMALFGEKYGDVVRVVEIANENDNEKMHSVELCGGTHVGNTSDIMVFKILSESGVASGVRRIEAVTGLTALGYYREQEDKLKDICKAVKSDMANVVQKVENVIAEGKTLAKEVEKMKAEKLSNSTGDLEDNKQVIGGVDVLVTEVQGVDMDGLRNLSDQMKNNRESYVLVFICGADSKVNIIVTASDDAVKKGIHCGNIIKQVAGICGGGGGGRPNMAQAGGKDVSKIPDALLLASELVSTVLA